MLKVLAIDDEDYILQMVSDLLKVQNYEVVTARGGTSGIKQAKLFKPDLILCDIEMPDISGYSVLNMLSEDSHFQDTPFIFLTGLNSREHMRKGMEQGADDYLTKPFTYNELLGAIKIRMDKAQKVQNKLQSTQAAYQHELEQARNFDPTTNLRNSLSLNSQLMQLQASYAPDTTMAVMIQIDQFESFEQEYSLPFSKAVLKYVANQLKHIFGPGDEHLFYLSTNSFLLLLPNKQSAQKTSAHYSNNFLHAVQLMLNHLSQPFKICQRQVELTLSAGISIYGVDANEPEALIKYAAEACQKVKNRGGNDYAFYL